MYLLRSIRGWVEVYKENGRGNYIGSIDAFLWSVLRWLSVDLAIWPMNLSSLENLYPLVSLL